MRRSFSYILPHVRTLRHWYTVVDGKPGFTQKALNAIKIKSQQGPVYCNLTVDEMCIKKYKELDTRKNVYVYINMGVNYDFDKDDIRQARNAIQFINPINWIFPY